MRRKVHGHGVNLVRHKRRDLDRAGVRRVGRITGLSSGRPVTGDGEVLRPDTVLWCTGYRQDLDWIDLPVRDQAGELRHRRGVVEQQPGLGFLGLDFQYAVASATIQGLDRDARYLLRSMRRQSGQEPSGHGRPGTAPHTGREPVAAGEGTNR